MLKEEENHRQDYFSSSKEKHSYLKPPGSAVIKWHLDKNDLESFVLGACTVVIGSSWWKLQADGTLIKSYLLESQVLMTEMKCKKLTEEKNEKKRKKRKRKTLSSHFLLLLSLIAN